MTLNKFSYFFCTLIIVCFSGCADVSSISNQSDIVAFSILGVPGSISDTNISLTLPVGADIKALAPNITVASNAVVVPESNVVQDFTNPVTYVVIAEDGTTKMYSARVSVLTRSAGIEDPFVASSVTFNLHYVPGGLSFPEGVMDNINPRHSVALGYWIGETEVTYELWSTVCTWALAHGYTFANAGQGGLSGGANMPVTRVNWRDALVFSNALTEWYNANRGTNYTCV